MATFSVLLVTVLFTSVYGALPTQSILGIIGRQTVLTNLFETAGLDATINTGGPFTLFAPPDYSLYSKTVSALNNDTQALGNFLKNHVVSGKYMIDDLKVNEMMLENLAGGKIRVNYYLFNDVITVEGSQIVRPDQLASNGVVHGISRPIFLPNGTIFDIISTSTNFTSLKTAVETAGLSNFLTEGPYTLMAPSNDAFNTLGSGTVQKLLARPDLLKQVLMYHVLHGSLYTAGMHSGSFHTLEEVDREKFSQFFMGSVLVDGSHILMRDISATNGVVHMIDHVLIPSSLKIEINAL
ncbi:hypothetical protein ACJMK2_031494 [Sinanodonta woodiana]|uniref:FAS1 domain-containing protein n=1 Tax=Sinanodonta woodiana TaxID=1069815 RepID=A0ABD3WYZ6_SINWO